MSQSDLLDEQLTAARTIEEPIEAILPINVVDDPLAHQQSSQQLIKISSTSQTRRSRNFLPLVSRSQAQKPTQSIFDQLDMIIVKQQDFLSKNKLNYEKTMIKLYKLDALQSEKAQQLLKDLSQPKESVIPKIPKKKKNHKQKKVPSEKQKLERNTSLPIRTTKKHKSKEKKQLKRKQLQNEFQAIQQKMVDIGTLMKVLNQINTYLLKKFQQVDDKKQEMDISIFKFKQKPDERSYDRWERLSYNQRIKPEMSTFDKELEKLNVYYNRNENHLQEYLKIQSHLASLQK